MFSERDYIHGEVEAGFSQLLGLLLSLLDFHLSTLLHLTDLPLQGQRKRRDSGSDFHLFTNLSRSKVSGLAIT